MVWQSVSSQDGMVVKIIQKEGTNSATLRTRKGFGGDDKIHTKPAVQFVFN